MKVIAESHPGFSVLRYSGTHACRDDDHERDHRVREYVDERVRAGQYRFLVDVRDLRVVYGSGIGDLLRSWSPRPCDGRVRIAILWKPSRKHPDRWAYWSATIEKAVGSSVWVRCGSSATRFFVDEDNAHVVLVDEE